TPDVPTVAPGTRAVVADAGALAQALLEQGARLTDELEWWVDLEDDARLAALEAHVTSLGGELDSRHAETLERRDSPLRVGVQAVLWLGVLGASLLAAIGYAVYATVTVRDRNLEFAQLRAIGLQRRSLLGVISRESMLISGLAAVFGIGLGSLLGWPVAPLLPRSPAGPTPGPAARGELARVHAHLGPRRRLRHRARVPPGVARRPPHLPLARRLEAGPGGLGAPPVGPDRTARGRGRDPARGRRRRRVPH